MKKLTDFINKYFIKIMFVTSLFVFLISGSNLLYGVYKGVFGFIFNLCIMLISIVTIKQFAEEK
jgi:hypothetical protein